MKETEVWAKFREAWPYHAERHEPGTAIDAGMPDVWVQDKNGVPGLIELKRPAHVVLENSQWIWHERWQRRGRSCVVTCAPWVNRRPELSKIQRESVLWAVYSINGKQRLLTKRQDRLTRAGLLATLAFVLDLDVDI